MPAGPRNRPHTKPRCESGLRNVLPAGRSGACCESGAPRSTSRLSASRARLTFNLVHSLCGGLKGVCHQATGITSLVASLSTHYAVASYNLVRTCAHRIQRLARFGKCGAYRVTRIVRTRPIVRQLKRFVCSTRSATVSGFVHPELNRDKYSRLSAFSLPVKAPFLREHTSLALAFKGRISETKTGC